MFNQILLNEISGHESSLDSVKMKGEGMIAAEHFASDEVEQKLLELQSLWRELKLLAARRTQKLSDSQAGQRVVLSCWLSDSSIARDGGIWLIRAL